MFVLGPWARPTRMAPVPRSTAQIVLAAFVAIVVVALVLAALLIARYNLRAQRADRRGAARLAVFVMIGYASLWVISGHHVADVAQEVSMFTRSYGSVLMAACRSGSFISRSSRTFGDSGRMAYSAGRDCSPAACAIRASAATFSWVASSAPA